MFAFFHHTVGVSTVTEYLHEISVPPRWISEGPGGTGFVEAANAVIAAKANPIRPDERFTAAKPLGFPRQTDWFGRKKLMERMVYIGLDVHAEMIAVATADDGRNGDVRFYGIIENNADAVLRLTKRLSATGARPAAVPYDEGASPGPEMPWPVPWSRRVGPTGIHRLHLGYRQRTRWSPYAAVQTSNPFAERGSWSRHPPAGIACLEPVGAPEKGWDSDVDLDWRAHRFASAFLLPASQFSVEIDTAAIWELERLKARWKISIKAQIMRLRRLQILDKSSATRLYKIYSAKG
jgi:hypothetical protein